jgi:hypothetical protein
MASSPVQSAVFSRTLVGLALGATVGMASALVFLLAAAAAGAHETGIAADQRPWIILVLAVATFGVVGLLALVLTAWTAGTARLPRWARSAWWGDRNDPPLFTSAAAGGPKHAARIALGVLAGGLPFVILGGPLQGMLLGWLLNGSGALTAIESAIVVVEIAAVLLWSAYLAGPLRR